MRFRDVEIARTQSSKRVDRIHYAPTQSLRMLRKTINKADRENINVSIKDTPVDGTALKGKVFQAL